MSANQVAEVLGVMLATSDASERRQADAWLQAFQKSNEAWTVGATLITPGFSLPVQLFGATMLCNKLKGGSGGGLSTSDALSLRSELLRQLASITDSKLQAQVCRAVSLLVGCCDGDGAQATVALLADSGVARIPFTALLQILTMIPDSGGWRSDGEVNTILNLQCDLLTFALCEGAPFPQLLPPGCAPVDLTELLRVEVRCAVLRCVVSWASLPAGDEGLCLSMLAELPCFTPLITCVRGDSGPLVQRCAVELCVAALEHETTSPGLRGTYLPFVGLELTSQFVGALAASLGPVAESAGRSDALSEEEDEDDESSVHGAMVVLSATLLAASSAILVEGAASPPDALSLLRHLVMCSGHARRNISEVACTTSLWAPVLGVADGWEEGLRLQLHTSLVASHLARLSFPLDDQVAPPPAA